MKRTTLSHHIDALQGESLMLLRFQLAYNRISGFSDFQDISRSEFVDRWLALKAIENDLVVRICKFDDDTKGVHSFKKAINELTATHPNKNQIKEKTKQFSQLIRDLKQSRRNENLAHLKIGKEDLQYDPKYNLIPAIKLIIEIVDLMTDNRVKYEWNDGQYEKFDLRKEVLKEMQIP
jgi:predicted RNA-binding protein with RPS1 domain